jgi:vancomycin permeability regulator SanA
MKVVSHRISSQLAILCQWLKARWRVLAILAGGAALFPVMAIVVSYLVIAPNGAYILSAQNPRDIQTKQVGVGIVLGSGITKDGKPFRELQSRLDSAADALEYGYVDKLVLSGDNRYAGYNEPKAMRTYLINERGVDPGKLQPDYAGRSTFESCERASKVFGLHKVILFSAESHLPRAIYLCRQFGIETYGIASHAEANNATRREAIARVKALFNVYVNGERTILGAPIKM